MFSFKEKIARVAIILGIFFGTAGIAYAVSLVVPQGGTGSASFQKYPIVGAGSTGPLTASSTLWVVGLNATSTSASSTVAYGLQVKQFRVTDLTAANCDLKALSDGYVYCGTDATGGGGGSYPFTPATNYAVAVQATSGIPWFQNGLFASSTSRFVQASSSLLTATTLFATDVYGEQNTPLNFYTPVGNGSLLRNINFTAGNALSGNNDGGDITFQAGVKSGAGLQGGVAFLSGGNTQVFVGYNGTEHVGVFSGGSSGTAYLSTSALSADHTVTFPDNNGVICLKDVNCAATTTANSWSALQQFNGNASTSLLTVSTQLFGGLGSSAAPTYTFTGDTDTGIYSSGANTINFSNGGTNFLQITSGGNLDFVASTGANQFLSAGQGNLTNPDYASHNDTNTGLTLKNDDTLQLVTAGASRLFIDSTGKVGIASTTPAQNLSVQGNALISGNITSVANITATGTVGIGTTTPAKTLGVQGNVIVSGDISVAGATATGTVQLNSATVIQRTYPVFTYSTTTWTGTTTFPIGTAYVAETWNGVECFTDTGTLQVSINDGTNRMNFLNASTTANKNLLSVNNTFTAAEKRYLDVGTPASSPTKISCTFDKTVNQ